MQHIYIAVEKYWNNQKIQELMYIKNIYYYNNVKWKPGAGDTSLSHVRVARTFHIQGDECSVFIIFDDYIQKCSWVSNSYN